MSSSGVPPSSAAPTAGLGSIQGSQAQFQSLLNILTQMLQALQSSTQGSLYTVTAVTSSPYTVSGASGTFSVRLSPAGAAIVTLAAGGPYLVADGAGNAATNQITINPPSGYTIRGASSYTINTNWGSVLLIPDGQNFITLL